ncbi:MAG: hypothetical protein HOV80_38025, partial [Polyangiaceae bacterium]|nr:hypothetical protein [Polyangiaceae bacterium]
VTLGLAVQSPGRLLPTLESRAGLPAPRTLSDALERLLIDECARAARVPLFDDEEHDAPAGAVAAVAKLIRSLRRNRVAPSQFAEAGGDARVADAYRLFEERRIALGYVDETDRVDGLLQAGVPSMAIVLEDPTFPSRISWELARAAIDTSSSCHIGSSDLAFDRALADWTVQLAALGFTTRRETDTLTTAPAHAIGGVGTHDEVELVAREMLALLRAGATVRDETTGAPRSRRASDILGIAPTRYYLGLLADACTRLGIPVASPRTRDTLDVPLVRALLETFRLVADPDEDTPERGLALLATPYVGLSAAKHDSLSRALLLKGIGSLRTWRRVGEASRSPRFAKLANNVATLAARLQGERAPRELAHALTTLGLDFGFLSSGRRANLAASRDDTLRLDQQGWEALTAAAEELNDALRELGINRLTARRWLTELTELLEGSSVRVDAKALDGVHITIAGAGLPSAAHVFALGWREGLVPRRAREEPLLPDRVKRVLNAQGAMLPLSTDRASMELERRDRVRRAARESLTISWPATSEDGSTQLPSFYLDDLDIKREARVARTVGDTTWRLGLAAGRGERMTRATMLARHRTASTVGAELDAVRSALSSISAAERCAYDGELHAGQVIQLPSEILAECTPMAGIMSASQAKQVVSCLYQHFGNRRLGLAQLMAPQLDQLRLGSIAHCVLNEVGRAGFDATHLEATLDRWWKKEVPHDQIDTPEAVFNREILLGNLAALVEQEREHLRQSGCRAEFFELAFGLDDDGRDPLSLAAGLEVKLPPGSALASSTLRGSIDRVDIVERDGKRYGVAIDYKSGRGKSYWDDTQEMADFQLAIYCEALPMFGIEPVGAVYLGVSSQERYGVVRSDFASHFTRAEETGKVDVMEPAEFTAFMHARQEALRAEIARLARGELKVKHRKDDCKFCDLRPVCRIGTFGAGGVIEE